MTAFSAASIASSVAGTTASERLSKRERTRADRGKEARRTEDGDAVELHEVEQVDAARSIKNNTDEDAREDHQERAAAYTPAGMIAAKGEARSIDVSG